MLLETGYYPFSWKTSVVGTWGKRDQKNKLESGGKGGLYMKMVDKIGSWRP